MTETLSLVIIAILAVVCIALASVATQIFQSSATTTVKRLKLGTYFLVLSAICALINVIFFFLIVLE